MKKLAKKGLILIAAMSLVLSIPAEAEYDYLFSIGCVLVMALASILLCKFEHKEEEERV